jgi:hypothetical protein
LLASLDERPDGWRRCALAFLEAQTWGRDFGQLANESQSSTAANAHTTPASIPHESARKGIAWLAIAAGVILAFTLGITMQRDGGSPVATIPADPGTQLAEDVSAPDRSVPDSAQDDDDALTLWVRDDRGQTQPLRVPLVDAGTLDRELGTTFQSAIPAPLRERFQRRGYDLESRRRYAPLWLENGRPMIVPVEDTRIVPVSQNVY